MTNDGTTTFNESFYLSNNPDVAAAIAAGEFPSAKDHFEQFGQNEGRIGFDSSVFDEEFYLTNNQDVADAIEAGLFSSALEHFEQFGQFEGREVSSSMAMVSLNPPTANDDIASTNEDTSTNIDVLANDTDPESDPLTITSVGTTSSGGSVNINGNSIDYDPSGSPTLQALGAGGIASDVFTYTIDDGTSTDTATVTVFVTGVNDAPVANIDTANVTEDGAPISLLPLLNDTDAESDPLTISNIDTTGTTGSVTQGGGFVNYNQGSNFQTLSVGDTAVDTFSYTADDGNGATGTTSVIVTINGANDAPVASTDSGTTDENTLISVAVLGNDTDIDANDTLSISNVDALSARGAAVSINGNNVDYDPTASSSLQTLDNGQTTVDSFNYTVSDGNGGSDTSTVTITVNGVNISAPTANNDSATTNEDTSTNIDVLANDTDADNDPITISAVDTTGTTGTVTNNGSDVTYDPNTGFQNLPQGGSATDSFSYTADDNSGGTSTASVTVTVTGVNDAPVSTADSATTDEDTATNVDVLANDSDPDTGDTLTITSVDTTGTTGTVTNNGTDVTYDPNGSFETLPQGGSATDSFNYTASDGNGSSDTETVTVTVSGSNDAPNANADTGSTVNNTSINVSVLTNDTDIDTGDTVSLSGVNATSAKGASVSVNGSDVNYNPTSSGTLQGLAPGATTTDTFTYTVSDNSGATDTGTATITVSGFINNAPIATNDSWTMNADQIPTFSVLANDFDPDAHAISIVSVNTSGTTGTVGFSSSTVTYNPGDSFLGLQSGQSAQDSFTYTISDGNGGFATASVTMYINGIASFFNGDSNPNYFAGLGGNDTVIGNGGSDNLYGQGGHDSILGGVGHDNVSGGDGNDTLSGGGGNDAVTGGNGNDVMFGGDGDDVMYGMSGDDYIDAGTGNDFINGGDGNDTIDVGGDFVIGGQGNDVYLFQTLDDGGPNAKISFSKGYDKIDVSNLGFIGVNQGAASGNVLGTAFNGRITEVYNEDRSFVFNFGDGFIGIDDSDFIF